MKQISLRAAVIVFGAGTLTLSGLAYAAGSLKASTNKDLVDAMHGEAFAAFKYLAYADAARAHGHPEVAELFERTAKVERDEHFVEHAKRVGLVGTDVENLRDAIKGESYETSDMYPAMARRAEVVDDKDAAWHFEEVGGDEAKHRDAFQAALAKISAN
ncbi:rubrerythrin family protein [Nitrospirillum iridis]|uniref:Rubrerythrin n=1 Tax=Nitrospirillum iridis TaxID=765888 RepID=A0A7X0AYM3_9PROT|nr:rubrerythrin family protein [Nitrospirillum iridis]MBB6251091.1 rubrerythrin [Nitrospirillum iridis]